MTSFLKPSIFPVARNIVARFTVRSYSSSDIPKFTTLAVTVPKKHVYHVELNRPDKLNSFNNAMWLELKKCFSSLSDNPECRVVVLSGKGKHFTAGIDLQSFVEQGAEANESDDVARKARAYYKKIKEYQDGITSLEKCVKPVLAVVHMACVGAGVDLISAADVRYCTQDSWFQVKEVDVGLAADVGTLQRLPKIISSSSIARELCLTARKLPAIEAREIGLVSGIFEDKQSALAHVVKLAEQIASKSPVAIQTTKQSLVYSQNRSNDEGLMHIRLINQTMLQSEDLTKAAIAQLTKDDAPEFENL